MHAASDMAGSDSLAWAIPFAGLLLTIAIAPLVAPRLWHHHYDKAATLWALAFVVPETVTRGVMPTITHMLGVALHEYLPFILLLGALFTVAGGLRIKGTPHATPAVNTALLGIGAGMASFIGTTGATMVLLRPVIRANRHRARPTHVFIFFILLAANVGGALSPLGDPPLFLGYLLGVPFFWPTIHLALPTLVLGAALLASFFALDSLMHRRSTAPEPSTLAEIESLGIDGKINLLLLAGAIASVLLRAMWRPELGIAPLGVDWALTDIVADGLLLAMAVLSFALTPAGVRRANDFTWGPIVEVAILFAAIFITLQPVTAMIAEGKNGPVGALIARLYMGDTPNYSLFYWATGLLSAFLDNAPTYVVFFGFAGGDPVQLSGPLSRTLMAISSAAVYFGALTYIGNAPNFMVKAIVESHGLKMPSFFGYLGWTCLCLLPWLVVVDVLFFVF
jgi:Na+/H+ antiporter NhaD/arsenite permease-like protein